MPWNWWQTTGKYVRKFDEKILFFKTITVAKWEFFPGTQGSVSHIFWLSWQKYRALGDQSDGDYKRFNRHKIGERRGERASLSPSKYLQFYSRHGRRPRCVARSGLSLASSWRGWWPLIPWGRCDLSQPRPRVPRCPCHRLGRPWPRPGPCRSQSPRCCPCPPRPANINMNNKRQVNTFFSSSVHYRPKVWPGSK